MISTLVPWATFLKIFFFTVMIIFLAELILIEGRAGVIRISYNDISEIYVTN